MKKIFVGLLFIFLSVNINSINFTPAWVGYVLVFLGLGALGECPSLEGSRTIALASAVLSAALWVAGLFGYGMAFPLAPALQVLITYRLLLWCEEQELDDGYLIRRFRLSWYALTGATAAGVVLGAVLPPLGFIWTLAAFAAAVFYTYTYYRLWHLAPAPED